VAILRPTSTRTFTELQLARSLHYAMQWQWDECLHGTYSGGPSHGQPYSMCEVFASRIFNVVPPSAPSSTADAPDSHDV
jgi:hypothetical protein